MSKKSSQKQPGFTERVAWLTAANVVSFAVSFLVPLIVVRSLNQEQFGTYKQMFQVLATVIGILYLQLASSVYYFMEREKGKRLQVATNVILFYLLAGLSVAIIFFVYPDWALLVFQNREIVNYIPLLGVAIVLWLAAGNLESIPLSLNDVSATSIFIAFGQIIKSLFIIAAALIFSDAKAILWASIIAGAAQLAFMLFYIHRRLGSLWRHPRDLFDWPIFKKQLVNSLPFGIGGLVASVQTDLHNYFVAYYFPAAAYAVYANGCFQVPLLALLQSAFREAIMPDVARLEAAGDDRGVCAAWLGAMRKLTLFIFPACALMFVLRYELITTLFTKSYADSVPVFTVYLGNVLLLVLIIAPIMRMYPEFRFFYLKLNTILIPVTGLLLYIGIRQAGLVGAVTAAVIAQALDLLTCAVMIARRVGLNRRDLRQLVPVAGTVLAVAIATSITYLVKMALASIHPILMLALCGAVFGIVYVVAAPITGALTVAEKTMLRDKIRLFQQRLRQSPLQSFASVAAGKGAETAEVVE